MAAIRASRSAVSDFAPRPPAAPVPDRQGGKIIGNRGLGCLSSATHFGFRVYTGQLPYPGSDNLGIVIFGAHRYNPRFTFRDPVSASESRQPGMGPDVVCGTKTAGNLEQES